MKSKINLLYTAGLLLTFTNLAFGEDFRMNDVSNYQQVLRQQQNLIKIMSQSTIDFSNDSVPVKKQNWSRQPKANTEANIPATESPCQDDAELVTSDDIKVLNAMEDSPSKQYKEQNHITSIYLDDRSHIAEFSEKEKELIIDIAYAKSDKAYITKLLLKKFTKEGEIESFATRLQLISELEIRDANADLLLDRNTELAIEKIIAASRTLNPPIH